MTTSKLSENVRKTIFEAVVEATDKGEHILEARANIAKQYDLTSEEVHAIEEEGIEKCWPPLEPCEEEEEE